MLLKDLDYEFPPELTATSPRRPSRVALTAPGQAPRELNIEQLVDMIESRDLLVVNETEVIPARVFAQGEIEILFLRSADQTVWEVLLPARRLALGRELRLPGDVTAILTEKGLPQELKTSVPLTANYFRRYGELALPPYIQLARGERRNRAEDAGWYQTAWAARPGSVAAPTASLHFDAEHLKRVPNVAKITLHVGAGTFLPVRAENLGDHAMHAERVEVSAEARARIESVEGRIWALGTTVARTLESLDRLPLEPGGSLLGDTSLFIYPPYQFKNVDVLLTNFHQPRSTLLALVAAFAGLENVRRTYQWAIDRRFNLFSYGDLSAWTR